MTFKKESLKEMKGFGMQIAAERTFQSEFALRV